MDFQKSDSKIKFRKRNINSNYLKYAAATSVSITTVGLGMIFFWTSPALSHLTSSASSFRVSELQGAWIASLVGCGTVSGYIINPMLINKFGSKRALLILAAPQILSWTMIYVGRNWIILSIARIIGGFGYGAGQCSTAIYLSEIGDEGNRGIFLTLVKLSINVGIFVTMFFGAFMSYNAMNLALMIIPIIFFVTFCSMPDSKRFQDDDPKNDAEERFMFDVKEGNNSEFKNGFQKHLKGFFDHPNDIKKHSDFGNSLSDWNKHPDEIEENFDCFRKHPNGYGCLNGSNKHLDGLPEDAKGLKKLLNDFTEGNDSQEQNHVPEDSNVLGKLPDDFRATATDQTVNVLKEETVVLLQKNTIVLVNDDTVDVIESKTIDFLNENTICQADDNFLRRNSIPLEYSQNSRIEDVLNPLEENSPNPSPNSPLGNSSGPSTGNSPNSPKGNPPNSPKSNPSNPPKGISTNLTKGNSPNSWNGILSNPSTVNQSTPLKGNLPNSPTKNLWNPPKANSPNSKVEGKESVINFQGEYKTEGNAPRENGTNEEEMLKLVQTSSPCSTEITSSRNVWWKLFFLKNNRNALLIIMIAALTDIFSGHMAIVTYTQQIFEYSGSAFKAEYSALILAVLKIGASLISTLVVEKFGRRDLFLVTGILAGLSQGLVGFFFLSKLYLKIDISWMTWLPLLGVAMYEVVGSVGLSSLYYVYQGELFSDEVKGVGVTCTNIAYEVITFFIKLYFQIVIDLIGIYSVFFIFGICCIVGSCLVCWMSPETKGKSKEEIQKLLS